MLHYGGCDGVVTYGKCETERRVPANGFFPTRMTPRENPFYLDLPFDDVNNAAAFSQRAQLIPWADDPGYAGHAHDPAFSYMKNRWVELMRDGRTCYGQIEDAGPEPTTTTGTFRHRQPPSGQQALQRSGLGRLAGA